MQPSKFVVKNASYTLKGLFTCSPFQDNSNSAAPCDKLKTKNWALNTTNSLKKI